MTSAMDLMQSIAVDWGVRCFGQGHMSDKRIRALRLVEEAIELAQSCDVDLDHVGRLIELVYSKPRGEPTQELGGVMITSMVMAEVLNRSLEDVAMKELRRVLSKTPEHFHQRNLEKVQLMAARIGQ